MTTMMTITTTSTTIQMIWHRSGGEKGRDGKEMRWCFVEHMTADTHHWCYEWPCQHVSSGILI